MPDKLDPVSTTKTTNHSQEENIMTEHQFSNSTFRSPLSPEQYDVLLRPVDANRVGKSNGQSNMEAYDIRAHLNRVFGFGNWDGEAEVMELISERWGEKNGKKTVTPSYRCRYTLRVRTTEGRPLATYTEWAMGDAINFPEFKYGAAHDFAMKTAESQALKRCAINLGDQFGLSLYKKGSLAPLVGWSLARPEESGAPAADRTVPDVTPETDPDAPNLGDALPETVPVSRTSSTPTAAPQVDPNKSTAQQWVPIGEALDSMGYLTKEHKVGYIAAWAADQGLDREIGSVTHLMKDEASALLEHLREEQGKLDTPMATE